VPGQRLGQITDLGTQAPLGEIALTVRDSSLSACTQAIVAAEVGQLELAHDYLREAALMDLHNLENNTRDGLHIASLGRRLAGGGRRFRWHA